MKILILTDVFFPDATGGAGKVAYYLSRELGVRGYEIHIITRNPGKRLRDKQALSSKVYVHRFYTPIGESLSLPFCEIINSYSLLREICHQQDFDIMCTHQSMAATGSFLNRKISNVPLIYYYHSPWHEEFLTKKNQNIFLKKKFVQWIAALMRFCEKRIITKSSIVITLSKYMKKKLIELHDYNDDKIRIIPGGIDLDCFVPDTEGSEEMRQILSIPPNKPVFLTVRNLVKRMGLENLIEAFHLSDLLKEKSILLIGGKGPLENHLKNLVSGYKLENTIRFTGHIPEKDLPKYYQVADYFVLPTEKLEGFGLVILESMACGTPVIGTPVGAIPELIGAFDKRLLTNGTSSFDIKEKLEEVINDMDEYHFDPRNCHRFVEDNYSWKTVADEFEKVMLELVER